MGCGEEFGRETCGRVSDYKEKRFCSRECYFEFHQGKNHHHWKGGIKTRPDGYIRDSKTDRYIHRLVMEEHLGRTLLSTEHIHHIDGNPKNNKVSNLQIVTHSEHGKIENRYRTRDRLGRYT